MPAEFIQGKEHLPYDDIAIAQGRRFLPFIAVGLLLLSSACSTLVRDEHALNTKIQVVAVGDMMLGTDFPKNTLDDDTGISLLVDVEPLLNQADITFGNLEGVLLDGGEPVKKCKIISACYLFRTPTRYVEFLKEAGFDVMSLANNHARDFGEEGRSSSMDALARAGIHHSGRQDDVASWKVKGVRVAMIAFAPFKNSNDMLDTDKAVEMVKKLAEGHDIVMVSFHGGAEGLDATRVPFAEETYYGENRGDVVIFSRAVIDAGADLVLGHGPHVPRAIELYQGRLIAYSLGNFSTYWGISVVGLKGLAPILVANLRGDGRFLNGRIVSTRQVRPDGPYLDESHEAARLMADLTRQDFPDTPLEIGPTGNIRVREEQNQPEADK